MNLPLRAPPGGSVHAGAPPASTDPVRVMVVDDSVVVRGLIGRWIEEDGKYQCVASHRNGRLAVDDVERSNPDVVILDVEMPEMDGLAALPLLLSKKPGLVVIMASSLTRRNAEVSLKALSLGAADYVPKPDSNSGVTTSPEFRRELMLKIGALGQKAKARTAASTPMPAPRAFTASQHAAPPAPSGFNRYAPNSGMAPASPAPHQPAARPAAPAPATAGHHPAPVHHHSGAGHGFTTRAYSSVAPRILAIGSSTGGPQALAKLFAAIGPSIGNLPVVVTQHMPPTFTAILAEHLTKASGRLAAEGTHGERILPGRIYVAPGGKHMVLAKSGTDVTIQLTDGPPVNFCKPAVDPLFDSVAAAFGAATLAVVLTGMGSDGANGARVIAGVGGSVIAQDEETSVVWGMPGAVAHAGAASEVLPLEQIGPKVTRILTGGRP